MLMERIGSRNIIWTSACPEAARTEIRRLLDTYDKLVPKCDRIGVIWDIVGTRPDCMMTLDDDSCAAESRGMMLVINPIRWRAMRETRERNFVGTLLMVAMMHYGDLWVEDDGEVVLDGAPGLLSDTDALDYIARLADLATRDSHREMIFRIWGNA